MSQSMSSLHRNHIRTKVIGKTWCNHKKMLQEAFFITFKNFSKSA